MSMSDVRGILKILTLLKCHVVFSTHSRTYNLILFSKLIEKEKINIIFIIVHLNCKNTYGYIPC